MMQKTLLTVDGNLTKIWAFILVLVCTAIFAKTSVSAENIFAYITNVVFPGPPIVYRVTVIDTATNSIITHIPVSGVGPNGVTIHPAGTFVYTANHSGSGDGSVSVIDTTTNTEVALIPLATNPYGIDIHPKGTFLYVANGLGHSTVSVIDTSSHAIVATVPVGDQPIGVAAHPAGTYVYVTNFVSETVTVIDTSNNTVVKTISMPSRPNGIAVDPTGTYVYVGNLSNLSIVDTSTNTIVGNVPLPCCDHYGVAVHPEGTYVYAGNFIVNSNSNTVSVIDTGTNSVVASVQVGKNPVGISVHPAGTLVYTANSDSDSVSVIDTTTNSTVATIPTGFHPISTGQFISGRGPITSNVAADPNVFSVNDPFDLTAVVDDSTTGGSTIRSASYNIDGGSFNPMNALDGSFDEISEDVSAGVFHLLEAGVHEACVKGTDSADIVGFQDCIFIAVYDPEGGFVTGGGWIASPEGAYATNPALTGKANFGFVSKYQKGTNIPTGVTEFQFKVANLNFHSDNYQWLVVAGSRAQFKGIGTINGSGYYGFLLTAIDGQLAGGSGVDKFRIKIWEDTTEVIVYDNKQGTDEFGNDATELGGGNIVIHAK